MRDIEYIPGGTCSVHALIKVPDGYPKCPERPIWLGVLEGSWYDIGKQYGESEGVKKYIPFLFDYWYSIAAKNYSRDELVNILHTMEEHARLYEPNFVEAIRGEADGSAEALSKAHFNSELTHYEKALFINFYAYPLYFVPQSQDDCSCIALLPSATAEDKVIVGRNTQYGLGIGNYGVAYAAVPPAPAHRFMTNTYAGMLFGLGIATDAPLYISRTAGIGKPRRGIDQSFLQAAGAIFGNSIDEAADLIVHGSKSYREATGRKTTFRANPVNYTIVDAEAAQVVETTAHSWAVRYPGDFDEKDFIIATNHYLCKYSYDENDVRTDIPMYDESICRVFGGCKKEMDPELKNKIFAGYDSKELIIPQPGTCTRYWALHWSAIHNHGEIDVKMLQGHLFLGSRFWYDINGKKIEYLIDPASGSWASVYYLYFHGTVEGDSGGYPEKYNNEIPGSLIYVPAERTAYWELYKPTMWEGKWEQMTFR